jgi:hypothetical protein
MTYICQIAQIKNSGSYMRYWQSKFDEEFLYNLCKNYLDIMFKILQSFYLYNINLRNLFKILISSHQDHFFLQNI